MEVATGNRSPAAQKYTGYRIQPPASDTDRSITPTRIEPERWEPLTLQRVVERGWGTEPQVLQSSYYYLEKCFLFTYKCPRKFVACLIHPSDPPLHTTTQLANSTRYGTHRLEREWLKQIFWKGIYVFLHLLTGFYLPLLTWSWSVMAASFFNGENLCNRYKGRNRARSWRWSLSQKSDSSQKYEKTTCPFWVADTVQDKD